MRYIVTIGNKSYEVEVEKGQANLVNVEEAAAAPVAVQAAPQTQTAPAPAAPQQTAPAAPAQATFASAAADSGEPVKAPMPGTILDVKVSSGQTVNSGDILFILEAMKMENEIMAPADGVVQVVAAKGATVNTGDVLASIQ
jgi:biotin carboxyl carrier protein